MATIFETDVEDYALGGTDFVPHGWSIPSGEAAQSVVSSPTHGGTRAIFLETIGHIWRTIVVTEEGIDLTVWCYRATGAPSGPSITIISGDSPFWMFGVRIDGGFVYVASGDGALDDVLDSEAYTPPLDTWFKIRVRAKRDSADGAGDGIVLVSIDDVPYLEAVDVALPAEFDEFHIEGEDAYVDDITLSDDFTEDADPIIAWAVGVTTTTKATRAIAFGLDGGVHILDEPGTFKIWGKFAVIGEVDFSGSTSTGVVGEDARATTHQLGGSRSVALISSSYVEVVDWVDFVPATGEFEGATVTAEVEVRTQNAGTSVTPKIRNVTDSTDAVTGSACTATNADYSGTAQRQSLSFTPVAGKRYRLMIIGSNTTNGIYGIGQIKVVWP